MTAERNGNILGYLLDKGSCRAYSEQPAIPTTLWQCFGNALRVNHVSFQCCRGKHPVYIIVYLSYERQSQRVYEYCTQAKSITFTRSENWIRCWCIMLIKLSIPATVVSYTCHPLPLRRSLIKTLNVVSLPPREVTGAERATFCTHSRASIHTEACPLRQLHGFDSMKWEGLSLPGVWYNESERTAHDLRALSNKLLETARARNSTTNCADSFVHIIWPCELYGG